VAQTLIDKGWTDARPLLGGFDGWRTAGYPLQAKMTNVPGSPVGIEHEKDQK
jgi:3-mercaptopyruvate sulfurtransferase SseA